MTGCLTYFDALDQEHCFRWVEGELQERERDDEVDRSLLFFLDDPTKKDTFEEIRPVTRGNDSSCCCCSVSRRL